MPAVPGRSLSVGVAALSWNGRVPAQGEAGPLSLISPTRWRGRSLPAMASGWLALSGGAARLLVLCALMSVPVVMAEGRMMPGGLTDRSVSDPEVRKAAAFAVAAYNKASNSMYYSRALEILQAQSQVVEGIKYYLKILLVNTRCEKRSRQGLSQVDLERCALPPKAEQQKLICKFSVWSRPWLNDTRLTSMSCSQASS